MEPLGSFYTSPGFTDEQVHLFLATGISDVDERPAVEHDERIDAEVRPLRDLDAILAETTDSKTLIGLYRLRNASLAQRDERHSDPVDALGVDRDGERDPAPPPLRGTRTSQTP